MAPQNAPTAPAAPINAEPLATEIAEAFDADVVLTLEALKRLVDGLPSLRATPEDVPESWPAEYAAGFLRAAYQALGPRAAHELIANTEAATLESRVGIADYLFGGDGLDAPPPQLSRSKLADKLREFWRFLETDTDHLLKTGLPSKELQDCPWLWWRAGRLYPVQSARNRIPLKAPVEFAGEQSFYEWEQVTSDADGGVEPKRTPCKQGEAALLPGIDAVDAERVRGL